MIVSVVFAGVLIGLVVAVGSKEVFIAMEVGFIFLMKVMMLMFLVMWMQQTLLFGVPDKAWDLARYRTGGGIGEMMVLKR